MPARLKQSVKIARCLFQGIRSVLNWSRILLSISSAISDTHVDLVIPSSIIRAEIPLWVYPFN